MTARGSCAIQTRSARDARTGDWLAALDAVEARLHELGIEDMLIGVITPNTEAMRLCERRGAMPFLIPE